MSRPTFVFLLAVLSLGAGCRSEVMHRKGARQFELSTFYGTPQERRALYWVVDGKTPNAGVRVAAQKFVHDRVAIGAAYTPYRIFFRDGPDAIANELQFGVRLHLYEFELGKLPVSFFAEGWLGFLLASQNVPAGGTHFNFTQDTGLGIELATDDKTHVVLGYRVKHLSNGRGGARSDNPSQNDHHVYVGLLVDW